MKTPNYRQVQLLVDFLESNPALVLGRRSWQYNSKSQLMLRTLWQEVAEKLNTVPGGCIKDPTMWNKYWSDKKSHLKKRTLQLRQRPGCSIKDAFTDVEYRMVRLMRHAYREDQCTPSTPSVVVPAGATLRPLQEPPELKEETPCEEAVTPEEVEEVVWGEDSPPPRFPSPPPCNGWESRSGEGEGAYEWLRRLETERLALERERVGVERERLEVERQRLRAHEASGAHVVSAVRDLNTTFGRIADALRRLADRPHT